MAEYAGKLALFETYVQATSVIVAGSAYVYREHTVYTCHERLNIPIACLLRGRISRSAHPRKMWNSGGTVSGGTAGLADLLDLLCEQLNLSAIYTCSHAPIIWDSIPISKFWGQIWQKLWYLCVSCLCQHSMTIYAVLTVLSAGFFTSTVTYRHVQQACAAKGQHVTAVPWLW